ncbi:MAG: hypothetical protein IJC88_04915 [Oscillospiraceae bacterium]|nr:hypothetical protein [Oscillospiraceae bacterium]
MIELITKKLHDTLGVTVYAETVPQGLNTPSISVFAKELKVLGECEGWILCKAEFRAVVRELPAELVADALGFVTDREGQVYRGEEIYATADEGQTEVYVTFRYRARVTETIEAAPLMEVMTQNTEV